jgi:UPF0755 protein
VTNEPSWEEIFSSQPDAEDTARQGVAQQLTRRQLRARDNPRGRSRGSRGSESHATDNNGSSPTKPQKMRKRRNLGCLWVFIVMLVLGGGSAAAVWVMFEPQVRQVMGWELPTDYTGTGNGETVEIVIQSGQIGEDIARTLHAAGVTLTFDAFYELLLAQEPAASFQPGTYALQKEMSAQAAFDALMNPDNHIVARAVLPEGSTLPTILQRVADASGVPLEELQAAATDYESLGLPATLPSLEGYLFPATYTFDPGLSAQQLLQVMVDRMSESLDAAGVIPEDRHRVLTLAALIQKEGGSEADFLKVSRVFTNRIEQGMLLQSDATVSYGSGSSSIFTSDAERADADNPYNTYVHAGLPIGPISAPGDAAINAALNPSDGPWLFFVLINGSTGETAFSTTVREHDAAVLVWQQWLRDNPDWSTG